MKLVDRASEVVELLLLAYLGRNRPEWTGEPGWANARLTLSQNRRNDTEHRGFRSIDDADFAVLLELITGHSRQRSTRNARELKNYVEESKGIRNRSAHRPVGRASDAGQQFRDIDTLVRLGRLVADDQPAESGRLGELETIWQESLKALAADILGATRPSQMTVLSDVAEVPKPPSPDIEMEFDRIVAELKPRQPRIGHAFLARYGYGVLDDLFDEAGITLYSWAVSRCIQWREEARWIQDAQIELATLLDEPDWDMSRSQRFADIRSDIQNTLEDEELFNLLELLKQEESLFLAAEREIRELADGSPEAEAALARLNGTEANEPSSPNPGKRGSMESLAVRVRLRSPKALDEVGGPSRLTPREDLRDLTQLVESTVSSKNEIAAEWGHWSDEANMRELDFFDE